MYPGKLIKEAVHKVANRSLSDRKTLQVGGMTHNVYGGA